MQEETVSETSQKQEEPVQQQCVTGTNVAESKVPAGGHAVAKLEIPLRSLQRQSLAPSHLKDYYT